ncbi:MAG: hypothetical protein AB7O26_20625, partial [Planctomycetaceae bacterium]
MTAATFLRARVRTWSDSMRIGFASAIMACFILAPLSVQAQQVPATTSSRPDVREVYVPADQFEAVARRDRKGVLLSRKDFLELYDKARAAIESGSPQTLGIVLKRASYTATIADDQLLVAAKLELVQPAGGWKLLALPFRGMGVEAATIGGKPARIGRRPDHSLVYLNDSATAQTLELELSAPLAAAGSDKLAAFGIPVASSGSLQVEIPAGMHLLLNELTLDRPAEAAQVAKYELPVGGRDEIRLRITSHANQKTSAGMVFANTGYNVNVSPGEVDWVANTNVEVFGVPLDRLKFSIPKTLEITDVESPGLESWELGDEAGDNSRTSITLAYRQTFQESRRIVFKGVTPAAAGTRWRIPTLLLHGAASHVGQLRITHPVDVRLRTENSVGIRPSLKADIPVPASMTPPNRSAGTEQLSFDIWQEDFQLELLTESKRAEIYADILTSLDLNEAGPDLNVAAKIETIYAPLFELELLLAAEWSVTAVSLDNEPVDWQSVPKEAGQNGVQIHLKSPLPPGKEMSLVLTGRRDVEGWPPAETELEIPLPEVKVSGAGVVVGSYVVKADDELRVTPVEVPGLDPANLQIDRERLGYRYQDTTFTGKLRIQRKPARMSVDVISIVRLDHDALRTHLELACDVSGGGLRKFDVSLPESAGTNVRFV